MAAPQAPEKKSNGLAVTGLVLGIIALVLGIIPLVNVISFIIAPLAIIFGIIGMVKAKKAGTGKGMGIAGLVTGVLALAITTIMYVAFFSAVSEVCEDYEAETGQSCEDLDKDTEELEKELEELQNK
ncbi:DUF4190 domain-containing protein [Haloglycomyces albus]|uniref:DUF4190 domain-containing protein n=1 Tax=Haloglycomyces albus TaxID=526067 RepID=UPI00046D8FCF|nr:DUF4190 domain-containing protein [Haloglycomyces albus]